MPQENTLIFTVELLQCHDKNQESHFLEFLNKNVVLKRNSSKSRFNFYLHTLTFTKNPPHPQHLLRKILFGFKSGQIYVTFPVNLRSTDVLQIQRRNENPSQQILRYKKKF